MTSVQPITLSDVEATAQMIAAEAMHSAQKDPKCKMVVIIEHDREYAEQAGTNNYVFLSSDLTKAEHLYMLERARNYNLFG